MLPAKSLASFEKKEIICIAFATRDVSLCSCLSISVDGCSPIFYHFFLGNSPLVGFSPLGLWQYSLWWFSSHRSSPTTLRYDNIAFSLCICRGQPDFRELSLSSSLSLTWEYQQISFLQIEEDGRFRQDVVTGTITRILPKPSAPQVKQMFLYKMW